MFNEDLDSTNMVLSLTILIAIVTSFPLVSEAQNTMVRSPEDLGLREAAFCALPIHQLLSVSRAAYLLYKNVYVRIS